MSEPGEDIVPANPEPAAPAAPRRLGLPMTIGAAAAGVIVVVVLLATPFWAPALVHLLPWGPAAEKPPAAAPEPAVAALKAEEGHTAAALQQLQQRVAALEAKPAPDLGSLPQRVAALEARPAPDPSPIERQLSAIAKTVEALDSRVAALDKAAQQQPAGDPTNTALALVLLQIRDAVDVGRPFDAEYRALVGLARDRPEIAAAAAPLAGPAQTGVAGRAALAARLHQLAPQIATAQAPPKDDWRSRIAARLRSLVTIRRVAGDDQTPAEAAVATAQHDIAAGDLAGAVAALDALSGPSKTAAGPWLETAKMRLAVEDALHQSAAALSAAVGNTAPTTSGKPG